MDENDEPKPQHSKPGTLETEFSDGNPNRPRPFLVPRQEGRKSEMERRPAYFTFDERASAEHGERLYYFALVDRAPPPYPTQRHVNAIIDIAADGTLAGVELIDDMPPPPKPKSAA